MVDPQVDDYVTWGNHEGWVYFRSDDYITIELGVRPKPNCEYTRQEKHKYIHTLLCCFHYQWGELDYVHTRKNKYGKTLEDMEVFIGSFSDTKTEDYDDWVAIIRTCIFVSYMVTNIFIVSGVLRHWNDVPSELSQTQEKGLLKPNYNFYED